MSTNPLGPTNLPLPANFSFAALFIVALIVSAIFLVPLIFYCLTLQKALNRCSPENRAMAPGLVWLLLVPLVGLVWHFFVVLNLAKSLGAELQKRGIAAETNPSQMIGLAACILFCCGFIPCVSIICGPAAIVCWIIYWVKIAGISAKIA